MKILVLGATGFMGRNVAEYFIAKGHEVVRHGCMRNADIQANLLGPKAVDYRGFDVVIQCAAATSGCKDTLQDPALHIAANGVMNSYILKECAQSGVKHVIFPSCSVMYPSSDSPLKETDFDANTPLNPAYLGFASTKLYCEKLCEFYAGISDTKFTVMRNTNFFGPYDKFDLERSHVFGATMTKVMQCQNIDKKEIITLWGSGEEARDFVHISDFCRFVELAIERQPTKYALYNCGSGQAVKINDLAAEMIKQGGKDIYIEHDLSKPTIPTSLCLDTTKAREELGWQPQVSLEEGIQRTMKYWQENCA